MVNRLSSFLFLMLGLSLGRGSPVFAETMGAHAVPNAAVSSVAFFGGLGTPENIGKILGNKSAYPLTEKASLVGLSYQHLLGTLGKTIHLKAEIQLIQHFTIQTCQEVTLAPFVRADNLFNIKIPVHVSMGNGVSALVGSTPHLEKRRGPVRRVLNYFFWEAGTDVGEREVFVRWHHRCHLFKTIAPSGTGSNFFLLGLRTRW